MEQDVEGKPKPQKIIGWLFLIVILLLISPFTCIPAILPIICEDIIPYRKDTNITPIMKLDIPPDLDLSQWTNTEAGLQSIGSNGVFTNVERFTSIADAHEKLTYECDSWGPPVRFGGQGDNQYCISAIRTLRQDPEGLCAPQGAYSSYVIIQKNNVIIEIYEETADRDSTKKDDAIEKITLEISQAMKK